MNMLAELKHTNQDHEWYPTTNEIIEAFHNHVHHFEIESLLDIGAGNGKVLTAFKDKNSKKEHCYPTDLLAIEKSQPFPRDKSGEVPSSLNLVHRMKD